MELTLQEIADIVRGTVCGDGTRIVSGVTPPEAASPDRLCVVWDERKLSLLGDDIPLLSKPGVSGGRDGVEIAEPRSALPALLSKFDTAKRPGPGIHPTAVVSESAQVDPSASVGPGCIVSDGAQIGANVVLMAGIWCGDNVTIGDGTTIEPNVSIMHGTKIGSGALIHAGAVIGCDGFGFIPQSFAQWVKIPHIGTVEIEDGVEIGPNCSVDRAMFGVTRIRRGTKIGALTQIAHNCDIGAGCVMSGFSGISGSVTVGDGTIIAGMAGVADHVSIGTGVTVAGRSGVTKDIPDGLTVSGFPAREHTAELRNAAALRLVPTYLERIRELEARVRQLEELAG